MVLAKRLSLLRREPPRAVAAFLAAALPYCDDRERDALATAALDNGRTQALAAVIGVLHRLGGPVRSRLTEGAWPSLEAAVVRVGKVGDRQAMLNVIEIARSRADVNLLAQVAAFANAPSAEVGDRAGEALLEIVIAHAGRSGRRRMSPDVAGLIDDVLGAALSGRTPGPEGRRLGDDILLATALLANRPGPGLGRILADTDHPGMFQLRRVVSRTGTVLVRENMLRWLGRPVLGRQVERWMHDLHDAEGFRDLLSAGHVLLSPLRRRAMRRVDRPRRCLPDPSTAAALPEHTQAHLVRLIRMLPLPASYRRERLADCVVLSSPVARLAAVTALVGDESSGQLADGFCSDSVQAVASLASRHALGRPGGPGRDCLAGLEQSPHRHIADEAIAVAARAGVDEFFDRWLKLKPPQRQAAVLTLLETHGDALLQRLGAMLVEGCRQEKVAAMRLAHRAGLVGELEAALIARAYEGDPHVASAAIRVLVDGLSPLRLQVMREAVSHDDVRVQANAVEALALVDDSVVSGFSPLTDSRDNRLRANVVRAQLRSLDEAGPDNLRSMLTDTDPRHRVSGVWVARRTRSRAVIRHLKKLGRRDHLSEVRRRATVAVRWIECQAVEMNP